MNFFMGVCEDNTNDPMKMGRIRVRVFGVHTENKSNEIDNQSLKVSDLPWAMPCYPSTSTIDGISNFSVPENGSIVMIAFLDDDQQYPVYFGTLPRIAKDLPDWSQGFSDPSKQHPSENYLNESPISRLARNENIEKTIVSSKANNAKSKVKTNKTEFDEPITEYNAKYPDNKVIETISGHVIEIDDTQGKERLHIYHKSGSFIELYPDGKMVTRIEDSKTTIVIDDNNILVEGNQNIRIFGTENVQIDGAQNIKVKGDINIDCDETVNITAAEHVNIDGGSGDLSGVVTGNHICHFTGKPHGSNSSTVKAAI